MREPVTYIALTFLLLALSSCRSDKGDNASLSDTEPITWESADIEGVEITHSGGRVLYDRLSILESDSSYFVAQPKNARDVQRIMSYAFEHGLPVRTRGNGHSSNATALPESRELLLSTNNLNWVVPVNDSVIEVGSGITIHGLNNWIKQYGFFLPVVNGGGAGPSVGGFISASGIGPSSSVYGGFWEQVMEITLVDGTGKLVTVSPRDSLFKWLFGSMGQLGVITSAKLRFLPSGIYNNFPVPDSSRVTDTWSQRYDGPRMINPKIAELAKKGVQMRVFWYIMIGPWKHHERYQKAMNGLFDRYLKKLYLEPNYNWKITRISFIPPLFNSHDESLICTGPWGVIPVDFDTSMLQSLSELEEEFVELVDADSTTSRYIQAEKVDGEFDFVSYYPDSVVSTFRSVKNAVDPKHILNRGSFFTYLEEGK